MHAGLLPPRASAPSSRRKAFGSLLCKQITPLNKNLYLNISISNIYAAVGRRNGDYHATNIEME